MVLDLKKIDALPQMVKDLRVTALAINPRVAATFATFFNTYLDLFTEWRPSYYCLGRFCSAFVFYNEDLAQTDVQVLATGDIITIKGHACPIPPPKNWHELYPDVSPADVTEHLLNKL
jgi:hypothetical protein